MLNECVELVVGDLVKGFATCFANRASQNVSTARGGGCFVTGDVTGCPGRTGCGAVKHARATTRGTLFGDLHDVAAVDESLQMLSHGVCVQPRGVAQFTDRALGTRLYEMKNLHS